MTGFFSDARNGRNGTSRPSRQISPWYREGTIYLGPQWTDTHHRSGWPFAIDSLRPLHSPAGVLFEGFVEKKFAWGHDPGDRYNEFAPYREPWIGVIHNPPRVPDAFNLNNHRPDDLLSSQEWLDSIAHCRGLFTLSKYLKRWLEQRVSVPVCDLLHPTEKPEKTFDFAAFLANDDRTLVQVGWWLRKPYSLGRLVVPGYRKALLRLDYTDVDRVMESELDNHCSTDEAASIQRIPFLSADAYDDLLSRNIVFLDLYDSSANNAVIECMVRATPLLINRLPAVVEYLGEEYPFYFDTLDEAAAKVEDLSCVRSAHEYLTRLPTVSRLSAEHFRQAVARSAIFQELAQMPPKVSIICSLFRADDFVDAFLDDLCRQTAFDQCELLLYDVADSHREPARVGAAISAYAELYPNIVWRQVERDPGLYEIWNTAIRNARGRYIAMACVDDRRSPEFLRRLLVELETHPSADVACAVTLATHLPHERWEWHNAFRTYSDGFNWQRSDTSSLGRRDEFGLEDLFLRDAVGKWIDADCLPHCMPMWRRSLHDRFGYFDEQSYGPIADWEFWVRCASEGTHFRLVREPLGLYWENPGSHNRRSPSAVHKQAIIDHYARVSRERSLHHLRARADREYDSHADTELPSGNPLRERAVQP
jgi:hypothetical protein